MKRAIVVAVVLLTLIPRSVLADGGGGVDPGEVWLPDGTIRWENLTYLGLVNQPLEGIPLLPNAVFERYQTPNGNLVLIPSPLTLMAMYAYPAQFRNMEGGYGWYNVQGAGFGQLLNQLLDGSSNSLGLSDLTQFIGTYESDQDFYRDLLSFKGPAWTTSLYTTWQVLKHMVNQWTDHGYLLYAYAILLYNGANCAVLPGGCPVNPGPPITHGCPNPTIEQAPPTLAVARAAPAFPLVLGQDPEKRGADVRARVSIPPVIFTWYELVPVYESRCRAARTGEQGQCKTEPDKTYLDGVWERVHVRDDCRTHVEVYPEPVTEMVVSANLSEASKTWILHTLSERYYQAHIYRPQIELVPQMASWSGGCGGGTCTASALAERVPFEDPGTFELLMRAQTAGTPVTRPRSLFGRGQLQVYLASITLGQAGMP